MLPFMVNKDVYIKQNSALSTNVSQRTAIEINDEKLQSRNVGVAGCIPVILPCFLFDLLVMCCMVNKVEYNIVKAKLNTAIYAGRNIL